MQEKLIEIDGLKLFYLEGGQGQPILFLHGGGARARSYQKILELLAQKYHVIAPDIPCFGKSSAPSQIWDFNDFAIFFDHFLQQMNLSQAIVIGHSFGGGIGLLLATKSARISKIILTDSAGLPMKISIWKLLRPLLKKTALQFYFDRNYKSINILYDFFRECLYHFFELPMIYQIVKKSLQKEYYEISQIKIPVLLLWGSYDGIFPLVKAQELNNLMINFELQVVKGGHDWCLFEPELLVKKIENFISGDPPLVS